MTLLVLFSCENKEESKFFKTYDESELIKNQQDHKISRMKFKLIQSKVLNMNTIFKPFNDALATNFSEEDQGRRNTITKLLADWDLITVVDNKKLSDPAAPMNQIKIIAHKDKNDWELVAKYNIGNKKK